jgi:hypothetical protein
MADWRSRGELEAHFHQHRRALGLRTIEEYDDSARETVAVGTYFEYRDLATDEWRVGYYEPATERFTGLTDDEAIIMTHFRCPERYVARTLRGSTYA